MFSNNKRIQLHYYNIILLDIIKVSELQQFWQNRDSFLGHTRPWKSSSSGLWRRVATKHTNVSKVPCCLELRVDFACYQTVLVYPAPKSVTEFTLDFHPQHKCLILINDTLYKQQGKAPDKHNDLKLSNCSNPTQQSTSGSKSVLLVTKLRNSLIWEL